MYITSCMVNINGPSTIPSLHFSPAMVVGKSIIFIFLMVVRSNAVLRKNVIYLQIIFCCWDKGVSLIVYPIILHRSKLLIRS